MAMHSSGYFETNIHRQTLPGTTAFQRESRHFDGGPTADANSDSDNNNSEEHNLELWGRNPVLVLEENLEIDENSARVTENTFANIDRTLTDSENVESNCNTVSIATPTPTPSPPLPPLPPPTIGSPVSLDVEMSEPESLDTPETPSALECGLPPTPPSSRTPHLRSHLSATQGLERIESPLVLECEPLQAIQFSQFRSPESSLHFPSSSQSSNEGAKRNSPENSELELAEAANCSFAAAALVPSMAGAVASSCSTEDVDSVIDEGIKDDIEDSSNSSEFSASTEGDLSGREETNGETGPCPRMAETLPHGVLTWATNCLQSPLPLSDQNNLSDSKISHTSHSSFTWNYKDMTAALPSAQYHSEPLSLLTSHTSSPADPVPCSHSGACACPALPDNCTQDRGFHPTTRGRDLSTQSRSLTAEDRALSTSDHSLISQGHDIFRDGGLTSGGHDPTTQDSGLPHQGQGNQLDQGGGGKWHGVRHLPPNIGDQQDRTEPADEAAINQLAMQIIDNGMRAPCWNRLNYYMLERLSRSKHAHHLDFDLLVQMMENQDPHSHPYTQRKKMKLKEQGHTEIETSYTTRQEELTCEPFFPVFLWSFEKAFSQQVEQIGTSACGATAVINVLNCLGSCVELSAVTEAIQTNLRHESAPLPKYLFSRSVAGTTADCLVEGVQRITHGSVYGRFFSCYPERDVNLMEWLAFWMSKGAVPLATLNLQRDQNPGEKVADAWHHQMIYGIRSDGIFMTNPLIVEKPSRFLKQVSSDSVLLVRRCDVTKRWTENTDLTPLMEPDDQRWVEANVLGQVVNIIRECSYPCNEFTYRRRQTSHVAIPAAYKSGITLFIKTSEDVYKELLEIPELPLKQ